MLRRFIASIFLITVCYLQAQPMDKNREEILTQETECALEKAHRIAKFYELPPGTDLKEITEELLESDETKESIKESILVYQRRIFVFEYPSDNLKIKGFISFTENYEGAPLLIFLRGGNRYLGLVNPAMDLSTYQNYTVISTTYRGSVSEGIDEFGGADVNDVKNLIDYIPILEKKLQISFHPSQVFMLGGSRGAMQMFLALARYPDLQTKVDKIVSLSGLLDMRRVLLDRPDMKEMFITDFGLVEGVNEDEWINKRDPILAAPLINSSLPILIIQGTDDIRVNLQEGYHMLKKLEDTHHNVTYWEVENCDHALSNRTDRMEMIAAWLEMKEDPDTEDFKD
jgi:dipeptidyl aminopeptidase/acylaminoacyl peptidase